MTVQELIEQLKALPQDLTVLTPVGWDYDGMKPIEIVETATVGILGCNYDYAKNVNEPDAVIRAVVIKAW